PTWGAPAGAGAGGTTVAWSAGSLTGSGSFYAATGPAASTWARPGGPNTSRACTGASTPSATIATTHEAVPTSSCTRRPPTATPTPHAAVTANAAAAGSRRHSTNAVSRTSALAPTIVATPAPVDTMGLSVEDGHRVSHDPARARPADHPRDPIPPPLRLRVRGA